jgi:hypothetical protein
VFPKSGQIWTAVQACEVTFFTYGSGPVRLLTGGSARLEHGEQVRIIGDEVEELVVEEMRQLGHVTLGQWAIQAEERVSSELRSQDPTVRSRKKNAEVVVRLWVGGGERADLAQPDPELSAAPARAPGPGADGLWLRALLCPGGGKCPGTLWI